MKYYSSRGPYGWSGQQFWLLLSYVFFPYHLLLWAQHVRIHPVSLISLFLILKTINYIIPKMMYRIHICIYMYVLK